MAAGPLPCRAPTQTKACYEIPVSLLSWPSSAQNKPRCQQKRRPPSTGAVYLAQGRAAVPALRPWQPPNCFGHHAWCGFTVQEHDANPLDWHRSCASKVSRRGSRLPGGMLLSAALQASPGEGRAAACGAPRLGCASLASSREGVCCALVLTKPVTRVKLY